MIQVGCSKIKLVQAKIDNQTIDGVTFTPVKKEGLTVKYNHDAASDAEAKAIVKKVCKEIPELKNAYLNVQMIDAQGRIL